VTDLLSLQHRIEALERRTTSLRRMLVFMVVLFAIVATIATTQAQQKAVTFADANGKTRVSLDVTGLHFYDAAGNKRAGVGTYSDGDGYFQAWDRDGTRRIYLGYTDKENPELAIMGTNGKDLINVTGSVDAGITINDTSETARLYLGMTTGGTDPLVRMYSVSGKQTAALEGQDKPFLRLNQGDGTERGYLGIATDGSSIMKLFSSDGTERLFAGIYTDGSSGFSAYNSAGTATWSSP